MQKRLISAFIAVSALSACGSPSSPGDTVVEGVAYVGATVSNVDQTVNLYVNAASLKDVQTVTMSDVQSFDSIIGRDGVSATAHMLRSVNAQVRYMQFDQTSDAAQQTKPVPVQGPGIAHLCFQVDGTTETYQKFLAAGTQPVGAVEMQMVNPRNPVEYAYVTDNDGLLVEVEHVDISKLELETLPKHKHRIRHISLATPDIGRLGDFYSAFLGQKKPRRIGRFGGLGNEAMSQVSGLPDTKVKMTWFQTRNLELELTQYTSHPTEHLESPRPLDAAGYNMIVFDVTNLDDAKVAFINAGGTIISEPEDLDGGKIMFGRDPDLNLIGLQVSTPGSIVSSAQFKNNGT